jgi:outer membrane protein OmpA-like peptidoglycan-associated protein
LLRRSPGHCACGGGCPSCRAEQAQQPAAPSIAIGPADDVFEREAERASESLGSSSASDVGSSTMMLSRAPALSTVQRCGCGGSAPAGGMCAACAAGEKEEEEPVVQRAPESDAAPVAATAPPSVHATLASAGRPLDAPVRAHMESHFGADFGSVRVHTDPAAGASAQDVSARAYTVGSDVVFAQGEYAPATDQGRRLIAHELAHVVQQGGASDHASRDGRPVAQRVLRRALTPDFRITGIAPEDAGTPDMIFFDSGSTSIPASEKPKIAPFATPKGQTLTLNGFADEIGAPAANDAIITKRLKAVDDALKAAGHTGPRLQQNLRASGLGQIGYRHMRSVEIVPTVGVVPAAGNQPACGAPGSEIAPCGTAFANSWPDADAATKKADTDLAGAGTAAAQALLAQLFSAVPIATVQTNVKNLKDHVHNLPAKFQCRTSCFGGCGRPAFNSGVGAPAMMTLCPDFLNSADQAWQSQILIHESAHGTPGLNAKDIAYGTTRQISFLTAADQVRNTDSYVLLIWLLFNPGSLTIGPAAPDAIVGMNAVEANAAKRAVAWVESWLNYGDFDLDILYGTVNRSIPPAAAWDTSEQGDEFNRETMHLIAPIFGLTDPGAAAPFTQPKEEDKEKIAGIHDRYDQMYKSVDFQVLTVNKGAPGSDQWGTHGASLPRLKQTATVSPSFFALGAVDQVKHLIKLMATAMSGISAAFRQKFVDAMEKIRVHRTLGP